MDMSEDLLAIRMLGKYTNKDLKELEALILQDEKNPIIEKAREEFRKNFSNAKFNFKTGPSLEDIETLIKHCKAKCGENLTMVAVDYLEKIRGPYTDNTANTAYIASRLNDMAKDYNVCIVLLLQPQKHVGDPSEPILSMRKIKGSSVIEQDCRVVLTMWRPGFDPENGNDETNNLDKYSSIAIVKQNMGGTGKFDFIFNPKTGMIKEMNQQERIQFDADRMVIEQRRSDRLARQNGQQNDNTNLF
jgi:replicative DNA helicase